MLKSKIYSTPPLENVYRWSQKLAWVITLWMFKTVNKISLRFHDMLYVKLLTKRFLD